MPGILDLRFRASLKCSRATRSGIDALVDLFVTVDDPLKFFVNVMKGMARYPQAEVEKVMRDLLGKLLPPVILNHTFDDLRGPDALRKVQQELLRALNDSLVRMSLKVTDIRDADSSAQPE